MSEPIVSNDPYHYPAHLMSLLIDTIPLLCRSKQDVLTFFRGCGVPPAMTADLQTRLAADRTSINKYEMVRTVLGRISDDGDRSLRARREVLKRVCEFEEFSTCWPEDQLKAKGLVADVRQVINVKDSFTRMQQEREGERQERLKAKRDAADALRRRREQADDLRLRLAGLSSMEDAHKRGKVFEGVLNEIFALDGLLVREAFEIKKDGAVVEQIDGLIEMDGQPYLVEAKWWGPKLGPGDIAQHLVRVYGRAGVNGLIISTSGFTPAAESECERVLTQRIALLAETYELLLLLEQHGDVKDWLKAKLRAATIERRPLFRPGIDQ